MNLGSAFDRAEWDDKVGHLAKVNLCIIRLIVQ